MQLYRDDGIVLRTQKLGEADRIITILGRTSGRIRAVAKGVRRTKSRFGSAPHATTARPSGKTSSSSTTPALPA